jgi:uncharacterized protein (DUF924 family)
VHEASRGRVGYLHLPDMMSAGFAEFHRYFLAECDRDGLIVDVRYNRGGHVSQLLLEKVARQRIGYDLQRWGRPTPYPIESAAGPVVALTNEHAGSDGDIFSHCFKLMKIGPLIGKRTWGGVIGIWPRHTLVDGTETTQPEFSFWFNDVGWQVENYGTDPDIDVDNAPQDAMAGRDRQLETALQVALERVALQIGAPRFGPTVEAALHGDLRHWADGDARGALALILLLDQFTRNIHRDSARAFAGDEAALALAKRLVADGRHLQLSPVERWFAYLPYEHSERLEDQRESLRLFGQLAQEGLGEPLVWAQKHHDVIARFGRYPHRNGLLGRESTAEEIEFLRQPGSRF